MIRRILSVTVLTLSVFSVTATAEASTSSCAAGLPQGDRLSLSDVTFRGSNADECFGVQSGNDSGARGAFIGWNGYQQLLSDNSADAVGSSRSWMGMTWSLSGAANARNGVYSVGWSDPSSLVNLPLALDLVVVLKASDRFASYLFNNESFTTGSTAGSGAWQISFQNGGNQVPKLSHVSVWARLVPTAVTEPGTLGLLVLGLAATAATALRRRREAVAA